RGPSPRTAPTPTTACAYPASTSSPATARRSARAAWKRSRSGDDAEPAHHDREHGDARRWHARRDAALARLGTAAARGTRHLVPACRDRLDGAAACIAPAGVVGRPRRRGPSLAHPARARKRRAAQPLGARRRAAGGDRPDLLVLWDAARQGARGHARRRADGAEDARAARPARRLRRLLPRLLH